MRGYRVCKAGTWKTTKASLQAQFRGEELCLCLVRVLRFLPLQEGFVRDPNKWSVLSKAGASCKLQDRGCVVVDATGKMDTPQTLWILSKSEHDLG